LGKLVRGSGTRGVWKAHKFVTMPAMDGGQTRVPNLRVKGEDQNWHEIKDNEAKCNAFH
jgi:hypothetical protein